MAKAVWNGQLLAESDNFETVEGNIYFPEETVKREFLRSSSTTSSCPWKGQARYYTIGKYSPRHRPSYFFPPLQPGATETGRACRLLSVISDRWFADGLRGVSVCACPVGRATSSPTPPRLNRRASI
ncbi:DUF427 domain-containing protein [Terriglobus sp. YAF25]|uniref:DUF427 domain-containing protein n=1 Tax=Terriglobus sp. YAF25 TaxID=3233080 RepID=UPI003F94FD31